MSEEGSGRDKVTRHTSRELAGSCRSHLPEQMHDVAHVDNRQAAIARFLSLLQEAERGIVAVVYGGFFMAAVDQPTLRLLHGGGNERSVLLRRH